MSRAPHVVDLYAGVGGFSLGFHEAGYDVILAIDNHGTTLETYENNFPNTRTANLDLGNVSSDDIKTLVNKEIGEPDVVIGGPPCQGFSIMGNNADGDERNDLLLRYAEHAVCLSPRYIVMENVKGLISERARPYLDKFLDIIESGGYEWLKPYRILNASDYGVPQNRERLITIAHREGETKPTYPDPLDDAPSVWDALQDIPSNLRDAEIDDGVLNGSRGVTSSYVDQINAFRSPADAKLNGLSGMEPVDHTDEVRARFSEVKPGDVDGPSQFHRLEMEGRSPTLRAGSGSDRGNHTAARPIHPEAPRVITVREAARLQSFPDWFQFHPTKYHGMRQIGNSVPPLLAKYVAEEIITSLEKNLY